MKKADPLTLKNLRDLGFEQRCRVPEWDIHGKWLGYERAGVYSSGVFLSGDRYSHVELDEIDEDKNTWSAALVQTFGLVTQRVVLARPVKTVGDIHALFRLIEAPD